MKLIRYRLPRAILLVFITLSVLVSTVLPAMASLVKKPLEGKTISILGDSISTYENISCADASLTSNSTIKNNRLFYTDGRFGVELNDTWWMQAIDRLGGNLLVNNSYSNSSVYDPVYNSEAQAYIDRCVNLHDDTGENAGEEPDIIIVYIGINDFSYNKDCLGSFSEIDFDTLIIEDENGAEYVTPKTTCEAYAIMLHKITTRYNDSEIYCFNFPAKKNMNPEDYNRLRDYNNSIQLLCEKYGCIPVDLFSAIEVNNTKESSSYFADGIHPNKNGMDSITAAFMDSFYRYSRYSDTSIPAYNIEYNIEKGIIIGGKRYSVKENDEFSCTVSSIDGSPTQITVTVNDEDVTDYYVNKNAVHIPEVKGNIVISASKAAYLSDCYNFSIVDNTLLSAQSDEYIHSTATLLNGTIENGIFTNAVAEFENTIELKSNEPWGLVWNASYSSDRKSHIFTFNNYKSFNDEGNSYIKLDTFKKILYVGYYQNGSTYSYGIDLSNVSINFGETHTYRLYNNLDDKKIYLYIDGKKIDALSDYYVDEVLQKPLNNSFELKDIYINYIGCEEQPLYNTTLRYIKLWESIVPDTHIHNYEYECQYELTCTEDERKETVCDCGACISEITTEAEGHKKSHWLTSQTATVHASGSAYIICEVCGKLLDTKILPQLQPAAPKIYSISNKINGIKIDWYAVTGAYSYRVYRRGAGEGYWTYIATVTTPSYLDTTATNNAYWRYTVRAGNRAGYGTYDNNGKYIKYVSAPHITKLSNETDGIRITWNKIYGASNYRVYRCRLGYTNWTYLGTTSSTSYLDKGIKKADGVYYKYTVRAVNCYYSDFEVNTQYIKRLSTPTLVSATRHKHGVEVKWKPVLGTTGYYVYRKTANSGWQCLVSVGGTNNTTYIDQTAKKGVKYTYTVKACYGKYLSSYNHKGITCKK